MRHNLISGIVLLMLDMWQAVHSGADLESAIQSCMGYTAQVGPRFKVESEFLFIVV